MLFGLDGNGVNDPLSCKAQVGSFTFNALYFQSLGTRELYRWGLWNIDADGTVLRMEKNVPEGVYFIVAL